MNEEKEIKEILEDIQNFVNGDTWVKYFVADNKKIMPETYAMNFNTTKKILDYITSLQEENEKLNKIIDELEKILKDVPNNDASNWQYGRESLAEDILDELTELKKEVE